jgi:hypothetical protein
MVGGGNDGKGMLLLGVGIVEEQYAARRQRNEVDARWKLLQEQGHFDSETQ